MSELPKNAREIMTTKQAAHRLGVSKQTIHCWRRSGKLPATKKRSRGSDGAYWFDTPRVEALLYQNGGVKLEGGILACYVYGLFDEGKTRKEVVMETRLAPEQVLQLWRQHRGVDDKYVLDASGERHLNSVLAKHGLHAASAREVVDLLNKAHERIRELEGMVLALKEPPPSSRVA